MNTPTYRNEIVCSPSLAFLRSCCLCFVVAGVATGFGAPESLATAVSAKADKSYVRARDDNGHFKPEYFAFGEGGRWNGPMEDLSIDRLSFEGVAHTVAPSLRSQNFLPATDVNKARLLIMLYWGTTEGPLGASSSTTFQNFGQADLHLGRAIEQKNAVIFAEAAAAGRLPKMSLLGKDWGTWVNTYDAVGVGSGESLEVLDAQSQLAAALSANAMANRIRDQLNRKNAAMLGYDEEVSTFADQQFTALGNIHRDAVDELEENRYFVVLMAYDFQKLLKKGQHVLLWETRLSIRQRGNDFDQKLPEMANTAARFFGQDTHGLIRERKLRERIRLDELKIIGEVPDTK